MQIQLKFLYVFTIFFLLNSCYLPKYIHSGNVSASLNFNKGKWILNEIETSNSIKEQLTNLVSTSFTELLGNRFLYIKDNNSSTFLGKLTVIDKDALQHIKEVTNYDFLVNIKTEIIANEIGDLHTGSTYKQLNNLVSVEFEIYDLNLLEKFYHHVVNASLYVQPGDNQFSFTKSADNLLVSSVNKILKKMKKHSVKKQE